MAKKALQNTYGYETVGGVEVRRLIVAGDIVPDHYRVESASDFEPTGQEAMPEYPAPETETRDPHEAGLEAGTTDEAGANAEPVGGGDASELKGDALEDRIEELGGYEALGLASDAKADEKRAAVAEAGQVPEGGAVGE